MVQKMNEHKQFDNISQMYPYGDFPHQYTKKNKEVDINNPRIFNYTTEHSTQKENKIEENPPNNFDINKLIPILTGLNKKEKSSNIMSDLLPLLLGNKSKEFSTLFKLLNNKKTELKPIKTSNTFPPTQFKNIDSYKKIE